MQQKSVRTLLERAFEGDAAPAELSVGIVSLIELCQLAMPDPAQVRARLKEAGFVAGTPEKATEAGRMLNLEEGVVHGGVSGLSHEIFGFERQGSPVILLLSLGRGREGDLIFCTSIFRGAFEADVIKAVAHVTNRQPLTGAPGQTSAGNPLRRVFWDVEGDGHVRGMVVSGPQNVESTALPRAVIAFNRVATRH